MDEPQAWIIVADRQNMETCAKLGIYGLKREARLSKMKVGDKLIAYIRKEGTFSGVGEVTKECYTDKRSVFEGGLFPSRIGIKLELFPQENAVNALKLTDELEFSRGKVFWQGSLASGVRNIPINDYLKIAGVLEQQSQLCR